MFPLRSMSKGPKPARNDSEPPPSSSTEFPGLERLDRPELDDEAPDTQRDEWRDDSAVHRLEKLPCSA